MAAPAELFQKTVPPFSGRWGAYVHVPFCRKRCGYCDFNTYTARELGKDSARVDVHTFAELLEAEIDLWGDVLGENRRDLQTVFFGGGTPSLLPAADLGKIIAALQARFGLSGDAEITVEANPETIDADYCQDLAAVGVNRISIGMQSAVPQILQILQRDHDPKAISRSVQAARNAGLAVSLDLIYGTPGESLGQWQQTLQAAISAQPDHISAYSLTVEPGTALHRQVKTGKLASVDDDHQADCYELADEMLSKAGYHWYEISNWARTPDQECKHNLGYWRAGRWLALGPGAHGFLGRVRWSNSKYPATWALQVRGGSLPVANAETLTAEQLQEERVLLGVRLAQGLPKTEVGVSLPLLEEIARQLCTAGLVDEDAWQTGWLKLTLRGRLLADVVTRKLLV